ncbi:19938_t:CDS:1 [Racocetra fulgida]|uniref:19938_t:CDS:1 n=1 Tax=Racocetra fulgida TaxID=60492 RepID=A0A9N9A5V9_9GLOM|nr:19938_t:CDS:1 [Racocetra fulgida]
MSQPHKEWFQRLFNAFYKGETLIEFPIDNLPPNDFVEIFNRDEEIIIKILQNTTNISNNVVWYWFKDNEHKIIDRAIEYIDENFLPNINIGSIETSETEKFNADADKDNSDKGEEWRLTERLIYNLDDDDKTIVPGLHYLLKYKWTPASGPGENDLIITNGRGIFAIVEVKNNRSEDDKKYRMSYALRQAMYYKRKFIEECNVVYNVDDTSFDVIVVIGLAIGKDNKKPIGKDIKKLCVGSFDEQVCKTLKERYCSNNSNQVFIYNTQSPNPSSSNLNSN